MNPVFTALSYVLWFIATYYVVFFILLLFMNKEQLFENKKMRLDKRPRVSVIVPAYNEEHKIAQTIASLKKVIYKNIEFIIVNDGSRDETNKAVIRAIGNDKRFTFIDRKQNKGKAASLNEGIRRSTGEYVACMDADSIIEPRMFHKTLPYFFENKRVGAVTVSVAVHKPKSILHRMIDIEYIIGLSLYLKVLSKANCVFVTPGPFSIYSKNMLKKIGGFDEDNITEDLEIAYRIHKAGYQIENCMEATVKTIVPPTFSNIYVQRRRWYSGAIQTLSKHRAMLFDSRYGLFAWFVPFNYLLIGLGLIVSTFALELTVQNFVKELWSYRYTGFNIITRIKQWEFDLLRMQTVSLIGLTALLMTLAILILGLIATKQSSKGRKTSLLSYFGISILYQIWWIAAIVAIIKGKKISWR